MNTGYAMSTLKGFQRKYLRSQAHHLDPVVMIGKNGLSQSVVDKIDASLNDHELIKIRFLDYNRDDVQEMCGKIAGKTSSEFCGKIGHVGIFFRQQDDPEKRKITLPKNDSR
jgi:RNA-binding protein